MDFLGLDEAETGGSNELFNRAMKIRSEENTKSRYFYIN